MPPVGTHCLLELHDCSVDLINDVEFVKKSLREASKRARSTLLRLVCHQFVPQGITALGLLAESHLSIHTWPEHAFVAIDVFTCGQDVDPEGACEYLAKAFCAGRYSLKTMVRGGELPESDKVSSVPFWTQPQEENVPCQMLNFVRTSG